MRIPWPALAGALLLCPAVAAADAPPPPIPYAARPAPVPYGPVPYGAYGSPYVPRLRYKRHSTALMGGGIALTAIGVLSILGGATAVIEDQHGDGEGLLTAIVGVPLFIHAAGCFAGGIAMWVVGAKDIPAGWAALAPSFSPGKTSTLRWTF